MVYLPLLYPAHPCMTIHVRGQATPTFIISCSIYLRAAFISLEHGIKFVHCVRIQGHTVHVHVYIHEHHMHVHVHVYTHVHMYMQMYRCVHTRTCTCIYIHVHVHVCAVNLQVLA